MFEGNDKSVEKFSAMVSKADNILLLCHRKPDADAIGSVLSLHLYLEKLGKDVLSACIDEPSPMYLFLPRVYLMRQDFGDLKNYDLIIVLDCGDSKMTDYHRRYPDIFKSDIPVVNIDHHVSNDFFGNLNIVIPKAASTSQIIYNMFLSLGFEITSEMATLLMAGLYYDTGSFKHDNTTAEVLRVASELSEKGARIDLIANNLFRNNSIDTLRLWGRIFSKIKKNKSNIVSSVVTDIDLEQCKIDKKDLHFAEVMNYLDSVPGAKFSVLLTETQGLVKGSFRTSHDHIDVSKIAKIFRGGGHKKAAGFVMEGNLKDVEGKLTVN